MKKFLKDHNKLRLLIMAVLFLSGLILTYVGWKMTGQMAGLGLMILGIIFLLSTLFVYNKAYT